MLWKSNIFENTWVGLYLVYSIQFKSSSEICRLSRLFNVGRVVGYGTFTHTIQYKPFLSDILQTKFSGKHLHQDIAFAQFEWPVQLQWARVETVGLVSRKSCTLRFRLICVLHAS